jgi:glycosyltransferase involved in cell wall biosynthesis
MKVLQMVDVPWDSGLAHYALVLSQGLKKKGHSVFVSAVPGQKPWHKAHRLGLKTLPLVSLKGLKSLRRFIREHGIDLIDAHTGSTHSLAVAAALGQKVAVVRTRSDARAVKRRPGSRFLYQHTQRVIAAADYIRESFIKELKLTPRKVVTIYQGVSVEDFTAEPFPKYPAIGIVARLDPVKGHRYLIEAMPMLKATYPNIRLRVIGQEENIKVHDLHAMAERLSVDSQIDFMGFQNNVSKAMSDCSVGIVASLGSEAVSRVALEWMASGRPVVATTVGCLPELVQDKVTGYLVGPKDAPALAAAIAKILHDPAKAASMGQNALSRVRRQFAMPAFIEKTLEVYASAIGELG